MLHGDIEARKLYLFIKNDGRLYRQMREPIERNLERKLRKGTYVSAKARKAFKHLADEGAKRYLREYGGRGDKWFQIFDAGTRRQAAEMFEDDFAAESKARGLGRSAWSKEMRLSGSTDFHVQRAKWRLDDAWTDLERMPPTCEGGIKLAARADAAVAEAKAHLWSIEESSQRKPHEKLFASANRAQKAVQNTLFFFARTCRAPYSETRELPLYSRAKSGLLGRSAFHIRGSFCREVVKPKSFFDPRSFRWVKRGSTRVLIGCPRGQWNEQAQRCRIGTRAHEVFSQKDRCPAGTTRVRK